MCGRNVCISPPHRRPAATAAACRTREPDRSWTTRWSARSLSMSRSRLLTAGSSDSCFLDLNETGVCARKIDPFPVRHWAGYIAEPVTEARLGDLALADHARDADRTIVTERYPPVHLRLGQSLLPGHGLVGLILLLLPARPL